MNNQEFNYILGRCKTQLASNPEFKAINNEQEAANYIAKNLNEMLSKIIARETELVEIFANNTKNSETMRNHLLNTFLKKLI